MRRSVFTRRRDAQNYYGGGSILDFPSATCDSDMRKWLKRWLQVVAKEYRALVMMAMIRPGDNGSPTRRLDAMWMQSRNCEIGLTHPLRIIYVHEVYHSRALACDH
jgi:hypothetical protein